MADWLSTLKEASFRGITFPISTISESMQQDLAHHKRADRDGAYVEATGRGPATYSLTIPFLDGLARSPVETWTNLFPERYDAFRVAWGDRSTGALVHPIHGEIKVKPGTWSATLDPDQRNGVIVQVTFVETNSDEDDATITQSVYGEASSSAASLDSKLTKLKPSPKVFDENDEEKDFKSIVDKALYYSSPNNLYVQRGIQKINSAIAKAERCKVLLDRGMEVKDDITGKYKPLGNGIANMRQDADNLINSLIGVRSKILSNTNKTVSTYRVLAPQTMLSLSLILNNTTNELESLNPGIRRQRSVFIVPNTVLKFYVK